jgi:hypothetical protein
LPSQPDTDPRALISDPDARAMVGGISVMTRIRWAGDERIGWPKIAAIIRGRTYYRRADVEALVDKLIAATASGEAQTVTPLSPHRKRLAKGRAHAGGAVA